MIEVPAAITTSGILACVPSGAAAGAAGGTPGGGGERGVVLEDDLDLLARNRVAVPLHVQLDRIVDLLAGRGLAAGHRQDQADLHALLRACRRKGGDARKYNAGSGPRQHLTANEHQRSPPDRFSVWNRVSRSLPSP